MTYANKLKNPKWKAFSKNAIRSKGGFCDSCKQNGKVIQCHHNFYDLSREPWEYDIGEVRVLCSECHESFHFNLNEIRKNFLPYFDCGSLQILARVLPLLLVNNDSRTVAMALAKLATQPGTIKAMAESIEKYGIK